jgi:hypothetical protein
MEGVKNEMNCSTGMTATLNEIKRQNIHKERRPQGYAGMQVAHIEPFPMIFLPINPPPLTHLRRIRRKRGASQCIL